jgi:hypothetical protein
MVPFQGASTIITRTATVSGMGLEVVEVKTKGLKCSCQCETDSDDEADGQGSKGYTTDKKEDISRRSKAESGKRDPAADTFGRDLDLAATTAAAALDAHRYSGIWHLRGA